MRWVVTGASGMLGQDVRAAVSEAGCEVIALSHRDLDITDLPRVRDAVGGADVVVNCAAWTAVDEAESHEAAAFETNALGPSILAEVSCEVGARLVHMSTDYVFDGDATVPYRHDHPLRPRSAYGRTKAAGEWAVRASGGDHLVLRTAWLYGAGGRCFPRTIARAAREHGSLSIVDDQFGQPTWTVDVADLVLRLVSVKAPQGVYHATSAGKTSWWEFGREVVSSAGIEAAEVDATSSSTLKRAASRPTYSVLSSASVAATGVEPIGDWRERWMTASRVVLHDEGSAPQ